MATDFRQTCCKDVATSRDIVCKGHSVQTYRCNGYSLLRF